MARKKKGLFKRFSDYIGKYNPKEWYAEFPDSGRKVYDVDVVNYTFKHLRLIDCFDVRRFASAILASFAELAEDDPKKRMKPDDKFKF